MPTLYQRLRERFINFYPPFLGAGIRVHKIDELTVRVEMKLTFLNQNAVDTHFGGSLYSMCDPWFMLILMRALGKDYIVWDKSPAFSFCNPVVALSLQLFTSHRNASKISESRQTRVKRSNQFSRSIFWTGRVRLWHAWKNCSTSAKRTDTNKNVPEVSQGHFQTRNIIRATCNP